MHALSLVLFAALMSFTSEVVSAQTADRTIDEIKVETIARAQTGAYPALDIQPSDADAAFSRIKTRDPDEWAAAWSAVADGYMEKAKAASDAKEVDASLVRAVAGADICRQTGGLPASHRRLSSACQVFRSAARGRPHSIRR